MMRTLLLVPVFVGLSAVAEGKATSAHGRAYSTLLSHRRSGGDVKTEEIVSALQEIVKTFDAEQSAGKTRVKEQDKECQNTAKEMEKTVRAGTEARDEASDDIDAVSAEVKDLEAAIGGIKDKITASNGELDRLSSQLKDLRNTHKQSEKRSAAMLRQISQVISKAKVQERRPKQHRHTRQAASPLKAEVVELKELSSLLSSSSSTTADESSPTNFLQMKSKSGEASHGDGAVLALQADKEELIKQSGITKADFDKQEKELIDLIELERSKLKELGENLEDQQPSLAEKLKQAAELERSKVGAARGIERDQQLISASKSKCDLQISGTKEQAKIRSKAISNLKMGSVLLEKMDTSSFLSKDLQSLKKDPPSFVQVGMTVDLQSLKKDPPSFVQVGMKVSRSQSKSPRSAASDDGDLSALLQDGSTSSATGPFDETTQMIRSLMSTLKDQANEDVDKHQFCLDSMGQNRREVLAAKNAVDTAQSTILSAGTAVTRLADQVEYLEGEVKRVGEVKSALEADQTAEKTRIDAEKKEHKLAKEVLAKVSVVLNQLCDLDSLLQQTAVDATHSRLSQCGEAAKLLTEADKEIGALDDATNTYFGSYETLTTTMKTDADNSLRQRGSELNAAKGLHANRIEELVTAKGDLKDKTGDQKTIQTAKEQLEQNCGPNQQTHEDRMTRRQDEIDALKNAYSVLDGEGIPVE